MEQWDNIEKNLDHITMRLERYSKKYPSAAKRERQELLNNINTLIIDDNSDLPANRNIDRCIEENNLPIKIVSRGLGGEITLPCNKCIDTVCMK